MFSLVFHFLLKVKSKFVQCQYQESATDLNVDKGELFMNKLHVSVELDAH